MDISQVLILWTLEGLFYFLNLSGEHIDLLDHLSVVSCILLSNLLHFFVVALLHRVHAFIFFFYLFLKVSFGIFELVDGLDHGMEVLALFQI